MTNESPATSENPSGDGQPVKTAKQLEKEAQKAAKLAKFEQKKAVKGAQQASAPKEKVEVNQLNSSLI
jgi:valyl-tRNA synthetase